MPETRASGRLTVDLAGLREVQADLRQDTENGLRSGLSTAQEQLSWGARFCLALECAEGLAARQSVNQVLARHRENAEHQLQVAEAFVVALSRIVENYSDADAQAAARISEIEAEVNRALAERTPATTTGPDLPYQRGGMLS